jgi:iron complex outermembrane receptor protein
MVISKIRLVFLSLILSSLNPITSLANDDFFDLSLEELMNIQVTTASKVEENAFESASAVYVITNEDIKRSGATSIPEALRLAPGVNVARMGSNTWAISARGFNRQFSNKLLVLFDGRSVYTPLFSGVYWDSQDYVLEDIERIEIVRGPGGTLWGANAVNGVINIITKKAKDTQGGYVSATIGNFDRLIGEARYGAETENNGFYRAYAKRTLTDETKNASDKQGHQDEWYMARGGFKYETDPSKQDIITLQGDIYDGKQEQQNILADDCGLFCTTSIEGEEVTQGGNIIASFNREYDETSQLNIQTYFDYQYRDFLTLLEQKTSTFDLDIQYSKQISERNFLTTGVEYRNIHDNLESKNTNGQTYLQYDPNSLTLDIYSLFAQNKTELIHKKLFLTLGTKFDYNEYTHAEFQPTARLSYLPKKNHHIWTAISRAVRTPTRAEDTSDLIVAYTNEYIHQTGDKNYDSEKLTAYELGYRYNLKDKFSFDITSFYNDYKDLRTFYKDGANYVADNTGEGETYGFEISSTYDILDNWRISTAYSFIRVDTRELDNRTYAIKDNRNNEGATPRNQFNIRSLYNFSSKIEFDNILYYNDSINNQSNTAKDIDAYIRYDSRIAYKIKDGSKISLVGQNLTDPYHEEFQNSLASEKTEIGRTVLIQLETKF